MGKALALLAILIVVFTIAVLVVALWPDEGWRHRRRQRRLDVAMDEDRLAAARETYTMLERSVRLHQRVLDVDALTPVMAQDLRDEVLALVSTFNRGQLPKG